jgi:predicted CoA-binding protein
MSSSVSASIQDFVGQKTLAVVGVSSKGAGFGARVYRNLKRKGYDVMAVNPKAGEFEGDPCYPDLKSLPRKPGGVVLVVPPAVSEKVVEEAVETGIGRVWMQEGAESDRAIEIGRERGLSVVHGRCIMVVTDGDGPPSEH